MIADQEVLSEVENSWEGMLRTRARVQSAIVSPLGAPGSMAFMISDLAHNLPFIQAFAVLNDALLQIRDEGHFRSKKFFLGALVDASERHLDWIDFTLVKEGVRRLNDVARHGEILARKDCWRYTAAVEAKLTAWAIIPDLTEDN